MAMSREQNSDILKIAKGAGISLAGSVTGRLFLLLSHVIIARFLGVKAFGIFVLATVVFRVAELVARFGLDIAAMRFVSIYRQDSHGKLKGTLISSAGIAFFNGVVVGSGLYLSAGFLAEKIFHQPQLEDIIQILSFCTPFMASMMVIATSTQGFHITKYSVYSKDIIQPMANFFLVVVFISLNSGIKGVVYATFFSHVVAFIGSIYFLVNRRFLEMNPRVIPEYDIKGLIQFSAPLLINSFLVFLLTWTDTIMLGILREDSDVGIYRAAVQIPLFMAVILQASNSIYAPVIAELFRRNEMTRLGNTLKTTTRWIFYLTLPIALVLFFSAKQLMSIYGSEFVSPGAIVLMIFTVAQLANSVTGGVGYTLVMTGKQNLQMLNSVGMILLNIILNLVLVPKFGSIGAALSTGFSLAVINIIRVVEIYLIYKVHPYNIHYLKIIRSGLISIVILVLFEIIFSVDSQLIIFVVNIGVVATVFIVFYIFTDPLDEDKYLFETVKAKLGIFKKNAQ